jgi:hypothetical protein
MPKTGTKLWFETFLTPFPINTANARLHRAMQPDLVLDDSGQQSIGL